MDRPERDVLVHRPDVRAVMLPQILRDPKVDATAVQLAAITYYSDRRDPAARTEELYHRLLLGQTSEQLEPRWDPRAAEQLAAAVDELPKGHGCSGCLVCGPRSSTRTTAGCSTRRRGSRRSSPR